MAPTKLVVSKKYTDEEMLKKYQNSYIKPSQIDTIIRCDTDVYTDTGELLLRFRKKKLSKKNTDAYYDATAEFTVMHPTTNRGNTSGCEEKNIATANRCGPRRACGAKAINPDSDWESGAVPKSRRCLQLVQSRQARPDKCEILYQLPGVSSAQ